MESDMKDIKTSSWLEILVLKFSSLNQLVIALAVWKIDLSLFM